MSSNDLFILADNVPTQALSLIFPLLCSEVMLGQFVYSADRFVAAAYKKADGMKIDGRRVLVDVERSRTVKGWLPRRLGKQTKTL